MNLTAQASRSFWNKPGIKFAAFAALVLALSGCGLVPQRFDESLASAWAVEGAFAEKLEKTCGTRQEVLILAGLDLQASTLERYAAYYGNEFDKTQAAALKKAVDEFEPGREVEECRGFARQLQLRIGRVAKVYNERPRR